MKKAFCPACGIEVQVIYITLGMGVNAEEKPRCVHCGFDMEVGGPAASGLLFTRVALVEDMAAVRRAVKEDLIKNGMVSVADEFEDGAGFIQALQAHAAQGQIYDMVILDLNMPIINGLKAAAFLRNLENQGGWTPIPLLFFSGIVCDERLQQHLVNLGPAVYLNKESIETRGDLADRLRTILTALKG